MRLAIAASPEVAIPTIEAIVQSDHTLIRIISQPDRPAGRGKLLTPTPVSQWAIDSHAELVRPSDLAQLASAVEDVDCVITIGYGVLITPDVLSIPRYGFLNLHFSLLPRWRGAAPVQRSIEAGDLVTGVTVFQLDEGMDTGPIYSVARFALDSDITSDELLAELGELGIEPVLDALSMAERGIRPTPQSSDGVSRARKLSKAEGEIDWRRGANEISAKIRAFTSNPGAWTSFRGAQLKIAAPIVSDITLSPGEIAILEKKVYIGTGTTALEIGTITAPGKTSMSAYAWANGARIAAGERCE